MNKAWKLLADDDRIWRRMCSQHVGHRCKNCGWGLPTVVHPLDPSAGDVQRTTKAIYADKYMVARNWKVRPSLAAALREPTRAFHASPSACARACTSQTNKYRAHTLVGHTDWVMCLQATDTTVRVFAGPGHRSLPSSG